MRLLIYFILILLPFVVFPVGVWAQLRTDSNVVETRIGNPPINVGEPGTGQIPSDRPSDYRQALIDEFGITMNGFSQDNYMWAWEFMHRVSNTRFSEYVAGTVVGVDNSGSHMTGCKTIFLRSTYSTRDLFTVVFTHEMGHVVYHCSDGGNATFRQNHLNALSEEGTLTPYSTQLCYYSSPGAYEQETENFAEMIAYYLNPSVTAQTGCGTGPNPFAGGNNFQHYQVARSILGG